MNDLVMRVQAQSQSSELEMQALNGCVHRPNKVHLKNNAGENLCNFLFLFSFFICYIENETFMHFR